MITIMTYYNIVAAGAVDREFVYIELRGSPKHATTPLFLLSLSLARSLSLSLSSTLSLTIFSHTHTHARAGRERPGIEKSSIFN